MSEDERPEVPEMDLLTARPVNCEGGSHGESKTFNVDTATKLGISSAKLLKGMDH